MWNDLPCRMDREWKASDRQTGSVEGRFILQRRMVRLNGASSLLVIRPTVNERLFSRLPGPALSPSVPGLAGNVACNHGEIEPDGSRLVLRCDIYRLAAASIMRLLVADRTIHVK